MLSINVDCKHNPASISPVSYLHILVHAGMLPSKTGLPHCDIITDPSPQVIIADTSM